MNTNIDFEKNQWIQEVLDRSDNLFRFLIKPGSEIIPSNWKGMGIMENVDSFLKNKKSEVQGVVRFWKHEPQVVFHFPGKKLSPVSVDITLNVTVSLQHASIVHDKQLGWQVTTYTPSWLKKFFKIFHDRIFEAEKRRDRYIKARDESFSQIILNPKINKKYETFRDKFLENIETITRHLKSLEYGIPAYSEENIAYFVSQFLSEDYETEKYLKQQDREIFKDIVEIFRKLQSIHRNKEDKIENLFILPTSLEELGAARARALGFLSSSTTELESEVEWSAISGEPFWWFAPDKGKLHDISQINWSLILKRTNFKASFTLEDITIYRPFPLPKYMTMSLDENTTLPSPSRSITNLSDVLILLGDDNHVMTLDPPFSENFDFGMIENEESLKWWLENLSSEKFSSGLLLLDPQQFSEIPDFPKLYLLIFQQDSEIILDACWEIIQSKMKEKSYNSLKEKYTKIMEKPLTFLFESASNELQSLREQVQQLVDKLSQVSMNIEEATKTVIDLAGGWTPTWIEKEIFVLQKVLENADLQELSRDQLILRWKSWLEERGMTRSERELMCNLRGLERVNIERYGIKKRLGEKSNAGPKPTIFYLAHDQIKGV